MDKETKEQIRVLLEGAYSNLTEVERILKRNKVKLSILDHVIVKLIEGIDRWQSRS